MQKEFDELVKNDPKMAEIAHEVIGYFNFQNQGLATQNGTMISIVLMIKKLLDNKHCVNCTC